MSHDAAVDILVEVSLRTRFVLALTGISTLVGTLMTPLAWEPRACDLHLGSMLLARVSLGSDSIGCRLCTAWVLVSACLADFWWFFM